MPNTLQDFFAAATLKASEDLAAAFLRLPEEKRTWVPGGEARTAIDQVAECALINGYTADLIQTQKWQTDRFDIFPREKAEAIAQGWELLNTKLGENTARVITAIRAAPDKELDAEIQLPWSKMTLAQVLAYPYWNMSYHEGQINYIVSLLKSTDG